MASRAEQETGISYDPPIIRYRIKGQIADERPFSAIVRLIHVDAGSDLHANDIDFEVLEFADRLWIIPNDCISLEVYRQWVPSLREQRKYFRARMFWPPKAWLGGGFLGLAKSPAAKVLIGETLPPPNTSWTMEGPFIPFTHDLMEPK